MYACNARVLSHFLAPTKTCPGFLDGRFFFFKLKIFLYRVKRYIVPVLIVLLHPVSAGCSRFVCMRFLSPLHAFPVSNASLWWCISMVTSRALHKSGSFNLGFVQMYKYKCCCFDPYIMLHEKRLCNKSVVYTPQRCTMCICVLANSLATTGIYPLKKQKLMYKVFAPSIITPIWILMDLRRRLWAHLCVRGGLSVNPVYKLVLV